MFNLKSELDRCLIRLTVTRFPHSPAHTQTHRDATTKMSEIIDQLGQLSAISQGLTKPVTTAQRLRMSENQTIYLLADPEAGSK